MAIWDGAVAEGVARDGRYPLNLWAINAYGQGASNNEGLKPTYRASTSNCVPYSIPNDILMIANPVGSLVTVRVNQISVSGRATASSQFDCNVVKRSSINTGGTPTVLPAVPMDSRDPVASAVVQLFGSNPAAGTLVGQVGTYQINVTATGSGGASCPALWDFGWRNGRAIVLHPGEMIALNCGGVAVPSGLNLDCSVEWTEETPPLGTNP